MTHLPKQNSHTVSRLWVLSLLASILFLFIGNVFCMHSHDPISNSLQISIESSHESFAESPLHSYFPVVLSNRHTVYCQNVASPVDSAAATDEPSIASADGAKPSLHNSNPFQSQKSQIVSSLKQLFPKKAPKCTYLMAGWWIYEFCFQKHIRQFHQEQDQSVTMEFFLGYGSIDPSVTSKDTSDKRMANVHNYYIDPEDGTQSYISFLFTNGTKCDLSKKPRQVEIRFYCNSEQPNSENYFGQVDEPESCSYVAKYYMKKLCEFDGFGKKEERIQRMQCLEKSEFERFLQMKQGDSESLQDDEYVPDDTKKKHSADSTQRDEEAAGTIQTHQEEEQSTPQSTKQDEETSNTHIENDDDIEMEVEESLNDESPDNSKESAHSSNTDDEIYTPPKKNQHDEL